MKLKVQANKKKREEKKEQKEKWMSEQWEITNKRGRHANLGCHGEEGVSFWGCLFTRKLLQHHGNDPFPFALQQADRQGSFIHSGGLDSLSHSKPDAAHILQNKA